MRVILGVMKKELLETIRDRRTLAISVFIPIMLMPIMMTAFIYFTQDKESDIKVVVSGPPGTEAVIKALDVHPLKLVKSNDPIANLRGGKLEAVARVIPQGRKDRFKVTIFHTADATSLQASEIISARVDKLGRQIASSELSSTVKDASVLEPIDLNLTRVDMDRQSSLAGVFLSLIVLIWATVGAMYPAADVTAGEKERQTLESLLMTPARDLQVILGKFASVYVVSLLTLGLAIMSTYATVIIGDVKALIIHVPDNVISVALFSILAILVTTALITVTEMLASAFAKSFRESQSYLTPIFMLIIVPGILPAVVPKISFNQALYYIPFISHALVINELSAGLINIRNIGLLIITSIGLTALFLWITMKLLRDEGVYRRI